MQDLKVTIVQTNLIWENPVQNKIAIEQLIASEKESDLIVLPEMFTTGFSMEPNAIAETMDGSTISWMKEISAQKNVAVCGSIVINENNNHYNRFVFTTPNKEVYTYDKRHLFTLAGEHKRYTAGQERTIIHYKGWKICPQICYDLRFPVWSRYDNDYELLIYVANWPKPRIAAWDTLLRARAIENMTYTVGVNRVGIDPNQNEYIGSSKVFDFLGKEQANIPLSKECVKTVTLSKVELESVREKFNFLNDRDQFKIIVSEE